MSDNPYESPKKTNEGETPVRSQRLDENTKEFLGIAKEDFWYYPGFVLLIVGCFFSSVPLVLAFFVISTVFLLVYLARSFPKYVHSRELTAFTKLFGLLGNVALIALQIVVVAVKLWFSFS